MVPHEQGDYHVPEQRHPAGMYVMIVPVCTRVSNCVVLHCHWRGPSCLFVTPQDKFRSVQLPAYLLAPEHGCIACVMFTIGVIMRSYKTALVHCFSHMTVTADTVQRHTHNVLVTFTIFSMN